MKFMILDLATREPVTLDGERVEFDDGAAAAEFAKQRSDETGGRFQVRPIQETLDVNWRERESARFDSGEYRHPLFATRRWFTKHDHYVHVSREQPDKIAFTASEEDGQRNRKTRMTVGRYLTQFCSDVLDGDAIREEAMAHQSTFAPGALEIASEADDIEWTYRNGPSSCMSKSVDEYNSEQHPVRAYADGDLAVAFMRNESGRVKSRAICWPEKKIFGRIYGETSTFRTAAWAAGYSEGVDSDFNGAKIAATPQAEQGRNMYLMPYIDPRTFARLGDDGFFHLGESPEDDSPMYDVRRTDGLCSPINAVTCQCCHRLVRGETTRAAQNAAGRSGSVCQTCAARDYVMGANGYLLRRDDAVELDDRGWMLRTIVERDYFRSAVDGRYYINRDRVLVWKMTESGIETCEAWTAAQVLAAKAKRCVVSGRYYRREDVMICREPHGHVAKHLAASLTVKCSCCFGRILTEKAAVVMPEEKFAICPNCYGKVRRAFNLPALELAAA